MLELESHVTIQKRAYYSPPWADVSIIAVAGSSGSGKSTLSQAIVKKLNLPWVVILSMVRHGYRQYWKLVLEPQSMTDKLLGLILQDTHPRTIQVGVCQ